MNPDQDEESGKKENKAKTTNKKEKTGDMKRSDRGGYELKTSLSSSASFI